MSDARPKLILINGIPGSGKTTLKKRLAADLGLPALAKDDLKEFLYDTFAVDDSRWPALLGRTSSLMLNAAAQTFLAQNEPIIIESAFLNPYAAQDWRLLADTAHADVVEIYCRVPPDVRRKWFEERHSSGRRHTGHLDSTNGFTDAELEVRYAPLALGEVVTVDTASMDGPAYKELTERIQRFLKEASDDKSN